MTKTLPLRNDDRVAEGVVAHQAGKRLAPASKSDASLPHAARKLAGTARRPAPAASAFLQGTFRSARLFLQELDKSSSPLACSCSNSASGISGSLSLVPSRPSTGSVARLAVWSRRPS